MKAAVVKSFEVGPVFEAAYDSPHGEGVPVEVLAAALSPRVRSGASGQHYASGDALPLVPGLDGVGRVEGKRVYFIAANDAWGTMAERTLAHERLLVPLPDSVSASAVAALMLPAISSWAALMLRAHVKKGERVLVLGATGTSGQLAIQIAKHLGAGEVIAAGRDAAALEKCKTLGADRVVSLADVAAIASEVDIVLDYLWGTVTSQVMPAICHARRDESRALRWVIIGAMAGDEIALSSVLLRKRNLQILGSGQGSVDTRELFGTVPHILAAFAEGKLDVNAREVPLAEVAAWWNRTLPSGERLVFVP